MFVMATTKLSIIVDPSLARFVEHYQGRHGVRTKSEVVEQARELSKCLEPTARAWLERRVLGLRSPLSRRLGKATPQGARAQRSRDLLRRGQPRGGHGRQSLSPQILLKRALIWRYERG